MKISDLIERLRNIMGEEGDIEVTCTGSFLPDGWKAPGSAFTDVCETKVKNLVLMQDDKFDGRKRVRLYF